MGMTSFFLKTIEKTGLAASKAAGEIFNHSHSVHILKHKSHLEDIVTTTDISMETAILDIIKAKFPDHGFDSEEVGQINLGADYIWVIDPLDGTKNLKRCIPLISTSLSCKYQNKTIFAAVS